MGNKNREQCANEMYEYLKTKHGEIEKHISNYIVFNYFEMYIKMDNGVELVYDADYDKFSTLETKHKLALILRKIKKDRDLNSKQERAMFGISSTAIYKCRICEYESRTFF